VGKIRLPENFRKIKRIFTSLIINIFGYNYKGIGSLLSVAKAFQKGNHRI
jgi:hypothetical protein